MLRFALFIAIVVLLDACTPGGMEAKSSSADKGIERRSAQPFNERNAAQTSIVDTSRPWAHNTGPNNVDALTSSGSLKITSNGTVLENLDITGGVTINADGVTLRNFRIHATAWYGIKVVDGHRGIVLEHGEIYGSKSAGILGVGWTGRRLHIHDSAGDAIKAQGAGGATLLEYSFIERLGTAPKAHADAVQSEGSPTNLTFRCNNIWLPYPGTPNYPGQPYKSNAAFILGEGVSNYRIENNWLNGGNYTVYCQPGVTARGNRFGRENGGWPDKSAKRLRHGTCGEWAGNVWEDSGATVK